MDSTLLMTYKYMSEGIFVIEEFVVEFHDLAARVSEYSINALCYEGFDYCFGPCYLFSGAFLICLIIHKWFYVICFYVNVGQSSIILTAPLSAELTIEA